MHTGKIDADMEKGKILARGVTSKQYLNSQEGQRNAFFKFLFATILSIFVILYMFLPIIWGPKEVAGLVLMLFVLFFSILGMWTYRPSGWNDLNVIYENGLSAIDASFLPFSEVKVIGEGRVPDRNDKSRFIVAVSKDGNWKHNVIYEEADFLNDFYEEARHLLKQKCPDVPWVEMEWLEWKKKKV